MNIYTGGPRYPRIQYPRLNAVRKKNWKFKEIKVNNFQKARQERAGRNVVKSSNPDAPRTWLIFLCPPTHTSRRKLATILLLAFSLFELVVALSQSLCSESNNKNGEAGEYPQ